MKVLMRHEAMIEDCSACKGEHRRVDLIGRTFHCPTLQMAVNLDDVSDLTTVVE